MIRIFLFLLWAWGMGLIFFVIVALSDLAFTGKFKNFGKRLVVCSVWPLALFSSKGRGTLFRVFRKTQEI
jgi:hypothetical protein